MKLPKVLKMMVAFALAIVPAPGKLEAGAADIVPTASIQAAAVTTVKLSAAAKIKRAHSNVVNLASADAAVGLLYTSTPITVTTAKIYRITATVGTLCTVDVGINGDDDAIVAAEAVAAADIDTLVACTIASAAVAAGKMVTASIHHVAGTSGTAVIAIEYVENE